MKSKKGVLFVASILFGQIMFCGFFSETLVRVHDGYVPIAQLDVGDQVLSAILDQSDKIKHITYKRSKVSHNVYRIEIANDSFLVDGHQQFYDPLFGAWVLAQDLTDQNVFLDSSGYFHPCVSIAKTTKLVSVHELSVQEPHTFFVGKTEIVAHNFAPVVVGISFLFGGGILFEALSLAVGGIGVAAYHLFKGKKNVEVKAHKETFQPPSPRAPAPKKPDDNKDKKKKEKKQEKKWDGKKKEFEFSKDDLEHMFDTREGHLPDTPHNRKLIQDLTSDPSLCLGPDSYGKIWYARMIEGGKELWAHVRNNVIRDCGLNNVPREFNPKTGLCRRVSPRLKP